MKVLIVTHNYLSGFGGGAYGARAYINAFVALYDDVTLLYPSRTGDEPLPEIDPRIRRIAVTDTVSKARKAARQVFRGVLHRFEQPFARLLEKESFDMVVFQNSKCSSRLIRKAREAGARTVVVHDNDEWEYTRDNTPLFQLPLFLPAVVRTERAAVREADVNLALTPEDAALLVRQPNTEAAKLPTPSPIFTLLRFAQFENADPPIPRTPSGTEISVSPLHRANAPFPMFVTLLGIVTLVSPLQR